MNFRGNVFGKKAGASRIAPAPVEGTAEQQDIEPVDQERDAEVDVFREQCGREWRQRDGAEKSDVNPGEIAVGAGELVELRLLADPEDAVRHHAHQKDEKTRRKNDKGVPEIAFGVNGFTGWDVQVEHEQGHGHGEDAVAEGGEAFDTLPGNTVVQ